MLTFPTYLLKTGRVAPIAMAQAIVAQREARPSLGELAVQRGKASKPAIEKLVQQQRRHRLKIGEAAVDAGMLTRDDVEALLEEQSSLEPDLIEILVGQGTLARDIAEGERERFREIERDIASRSTAREAAARGSFACSVARLATMKPFSSAVRDALDLLSTPEAPPAKVAAVLETDPAITVVTLRVANSAMYRRGTQCDSLKDAVVRLGSAAMREIITGVSVLGAFTEFDRFANMARQHVAGTAAIARILAGATAPKLGNVAFLAGLLHDIGKLLLHQSGEFAYESLPRESLEGGGKLHLLEAEALGYDHAVLGGLAASLWELPKIVADAVAFHHEPLGAHVVGGDTARLTAIVVLASEIEHHQSLSPHYTAHVARELENHPEARELGLDSSTVEEIWVELVQARAEMAALLAR